ncbi:MAG: diguanylate cyclase [Eubacteriales bacterium]|nr:diguanylate cyclase [Eubacteriales bacterium]
MDNDNKIQIQQILNIIKIASLAFPAIAFLQYYSKMPGFLLYITHGILTISILLIILAVYSLWIFLQSKIVNQAITSKLIDPLISMSISLASVLMTGSYQSNYKFLFVFVILFTSIECSQKISLTVAGLSSFIVLGVDLFYGPKGSVNSYFESDIVLTCVFMIVSWTVGYYDNIRKKHIQYLRDIANFDGLTELYNHRYFYEYLTAQTQQAAEKHIPVSLLFIDIDNFKYYNDLYGHQKGDDVLRSIALIMKATFPKDTFIARYGGEEFVVILKNHEEEQAIAEAEKLRRAVQEHPFDGQENLPGGNMTVSVGVSSFPGRVKTASELIKSADDACYRAKFLCKNRVEAYFSILDEFDFAPEVITQIKTLIAVINAKDKYTYRHVERVVFFCNLLADRLELDTNEKRKLVYSAYLHDIGKINIPEEILIKTDPLTPEEWNILKNHPQYAVDIIKNNEAMEEIKPIILQHHERYDGKGYPQGLKGDEIHYLARLLTVADAFDAMTSLRPYQAIKSYRQAIRELRRCSGTQFDPEAVDAFIPCIEERDGTQEWGNNVGILAQQGLNTKAYPNPEQPLNMENGTDS